MSSIGFLLPEYRERVLGLLLLHPESSYHVREIARLTHTTAGTLHRELSKLAEAKVLVRKIQGNQVVYQANTSFLIFQELANILKKTSGIIDVLSKALQPLKAKIEIAFVFGSVANGKENASSDIDVLLIGEISFIEAVTALHSAQKFVGREINPKIYKKSEWQALFKAKNGFVLDLIKKPKLFIIGEKNDLK